MAATSSRLGFAFVQITVSLVGALAVTLLSPPSRSWVLVWAAALVAITPLLAAIVTRRWDPFEPVNLFAISFILLFVARPIADLQRANGLFVVGYSLDRSYDTALALAVLGGAFFFIGYYIQLGSRLGERIPLPCAEWRVQTLRRFVVVVTAFAGLLLIVFLRSEGSVGALITIMRGRSDQRTESLVSGSGYLYTGPLWLISVGILLLALAPAWRSKRGLGGLFLLAASLMFSVGTGDRSWMIPVFSSTLLVWYLRRDRRPRALILILIVVCTFCFGITVPREYRNLSGRSSLGGDIRSAALHPGRAVSTFITGADTAMVDDFAAEIETVPSRLPYQHGSTFAEALLRPIPRALWHQKPIAADTQLMETMWPSLSKSHVGFAFSFFGEPYLNFGAAGVLFIAFFFGVAWRALYRWFLRDSRNPTVVALYALNWPFLFVYMRGGLGVDYQRQVIAVLPLIVASALVTLGARGRTVKRTPAVHTV